jgi:hypothetical protein
MLQEIINQYRDFTINLFIYMFIDGVFTYPFIFMVLLFAPFTIVYATIIIIAIFSIPYEIYIKHKRRSK